VHSRCCAWSLTGELIGGSDMSIEIEIAHGLATLKVNLGEFVAIAQQIAGVTKHREARQALKDAIGEIRKSCDTAVDVFTPLYALTDEAGFTKSFGTLHASFKNSYLKKVDDVRTHCRVVETHLDALLKKKEWMAGLPLLERSYSRLEGLCRDWLFSDFALANQMESFLKRIDDFYADISGQAQSDASAAFAILRSSLQQFNDDFLALRKQLNDLDVVSKTL
jgi:hypothetical protein